MTWTASYDVDANDADGVVSFTISGVTDLAGNDIAADHITNTGATGVTVDTTLPTITTATIAAVSDTTTLAKAGQKVNLTIVASENIASPTVVFQSGGANITNANNVTVAEGVDAKNWTASYNVHTNDTDGVVSFTISGVTDLAGNDIAADHITNTGATGVTVDKIAPTITTATIAAVSYTHLRAHET